MSLYDFAFEKLRFLFCEDLFSITSFYCSSEECQFAFEDHMHF